jgi:hypothetical protein
MWIQVILIAAMVAIAFYLVRSTPTAKHLAIRRSLVFLALVAGVVVVLAPGWLTRIANAVGIGRGTDFLFYAALVAFLFYVVVDYKRSVQLARSNTQLAREITIAQARLEDQQERMQAEIAALRGGASA